MYANSLVCWSHMYKFLLHRFKRVDVFLTISSVCWLKESLLSRMIPRYLSDLTSSSAIKLRERGPALRMVSAADWVCSGGWTVTGEEGVCMRYWNLHNVLVLLDILSNLHFLMLKVICHFLAQCWSRRMSSCSRCASAIVSIFRYNALSSANNRILEVSVYSMSLM